jgi:hypothetical protein
VLVESVETVIEAAWAGGAKIANTPKKSMARSKKDESFLKGVVFKV